MYELWGPTSGSLRDSTSGVFRGLGSTLFEGSLSDLQDKLRIKIEQWIVRGESRDILEG